MTTDVTTSRRSLGDVYESHLHVGIMTAKQKEGIQCTKCVLGDVHMASKEVTWSSTWGIDTRHGDIAHTEATARQQRGVYMCPPAQAIITHLLTPAHVGLAD